MNLVCVASCEVFIVKLMHASWQHDSCAVFTVYGFTVKSLADCTNKLFSTVDFIFPFFSVFTQPFLCKNRLH